MNYKFSSLLAILRLVEIEIIISNIIFSRSKGYSYFTKETQRCTTTTVCIKTSGLAS